MPQRKIPIVDLEIERLDNHNHYSKRIMENELDGIHIEYKSIGGDSSIVEDFEEEQSSIFLFIKGEGVVIADNIEYEILPETIFLPNTCKSISIESAANSQLHFLKVTSKLSEADRLDLSGFPKSNTQEVYCAQFSDCKPYIEPIKSPNTISRTILPNKYIPRIAMGTVQAVGPDGVGAHKHPMLEQLFLGLSENNCTVYADDTHIAFPEYTLLHIPLGSNHSVAVKKDQVMYYVWMDFFLDKKGEEWLKTHIEVDEA